MKFFGFLCKRTVLTLKNNSRTYVIDVVLSFNNSVTCAIFHKKVGLLVTNHFRIHTGLYKGKIYIFPVTMEKYYLNHYFPESAKLCAVCAHLPTCLACIRAHLPTCFAC